MNPRLSALTVVVAAVGFSFVFGGIQPARAACSDDLVVAQAEVDKVTDPAKKQTAQAALEEAKKAAQAGDEAACTNAVHKARAAAKK